jgi:flagellin
MGLESLSFRRNIISLRTQNDLSRTERALGKVFGRLSSGLRIQSASDDAAGLAVSERLRAQVRSISQAQRNGNDGISMLQTAEGALTEIGDALIRMRELAVQAANGTLGTTERATLDNEFDELRSEIDRLAAATEFDGIDLIDGSLSAGLNFQVGIQGGGAASDTINVSLSSATSSDIGLTGGIGVDTATNASSAITAVDSAIDTITSQRGNVGSMQNRLQITINNLATMHENLSAAHGRIADADVAMEAANMARLQILMQSGISVLLQANQMPSLALPLLGAS